MSLHVGRRILAMRFIRRIILAPTVIGFVAYHLASRFNLAYKPLLVLCGVIVGWPIKISLGIKYERWIRMRRAKAFAAVTASELRGKLLGDIDILQELQEFDKNGFLGEFVRRVSRVSCRVTQLSPFNLGEWFEAQHEKAGSRTFSGAIIGEYFISTADPGNIKVLLATEFNNFEKGTPGFILIGYSLTFALD